MGNYFFGEGTPPPSHTPPPTPSYSSSTYWNPASPYSATSTYYRSEYEPSYISARPTPGPPPPINLLNLDYYELCRLCGRTYGSENALKQHMRAKHEMGAQVYKCADCNRDFISQPALDIHTSASHKKSFGCPVCNRAFDTQHALHQHTDDKHKVGAYKCLICAKDFDSQKALDQHTDVKHTKKPFLPAPPFDGAKGCWVKEGNDKFALIQKGFGFFFCDCGHYWSTAHAYKKFKQACKSCNSWSLPYYLWFHYRMKKSEETPHEKAAKSRPHDRERCEACLKGVCGAAKQKVRHRDQATQQEQVSTDNED